MAYESVNPFDNRKYKSFPEISNEELDEHLTAAESCFRTWKHTSYAHRARIIARAGVLLHEQADRLARIMTREMGKRIDEARGEVEFSAQIMTYYAENAQRFLANAELHPSIGEGHMESSPIGVVFCVEPWNFPYYQLARVAGPQLMAGNTLVVKHAECVPQCAIAFEQLMVEAEAPVAAPAPEPTAEEAAAAAAVAYAQALNAVRDLKCPAFFFAARTRHAFGV